MLPRSYWRRLRNGMRSRASKTQPLVRRFINTLKYANVFSRRRTGIDTSGGRSFRSVSGGRNLAGRGAPAEAGGSQDCVLLRAHRAAEPQPKADQGVGRGPGGPPHKIVAGCKDLLESVDAARMSACATIGYETVFMKWST
ncbi:hypothetical protein SBA4_40019 [Candidatus Sulfopaludibacter sp. SbA4]|nr:hypothetical protein SBA4_40019 [Candidatus Sulfopaludibacter sp. SbA4]